MKMINIFNTFIHPSAVSKIKAVLDSTFLSEGKLVKEFETQLGIKLELENPIAVNSGTSALHLALILAGVKPGDEVICPAQTFVATGLAILQSGAKPIFADIQYDTGNIDPVSIKQKINDRTKAIMPVHWGGNPCDMDEISGIAKKYGLVVIEDAAHALGATYKGRPVGNISDFTCFSFQAIKHLTTGDGGALCCSDTKRAKQATVLRWFGIDRANSQPSNLGERVYDIKQTGYKYHMNDYAAALGLANLEGFHERMLRRRGMAHKYREHLKAVPGITLLKESTDRVSAYWLFGFHVEKRENFINALKEKGITASVVHLGLDHNTVFGGKKEELANQRKFDDTQIHIPIHDGLADEDAEYICNVIKGGW